MKDFFAIIGGMGTLATESLIRTLNAACKAASDQDYLDYIVLNHASVPDRTAYILGHSGEDPLPCLLDDVAMLNRIGPRFAAIACNTAHYFFDQLQDAAEFPILHMPREAVSAASRKLPAKGRVALLATEGTIKAGIYQRELEGAGLEAAIPPQALQDKVTRLIYEDVKEQGNINTALFAEILDGALKDLGAAGAILGCTELSVVNEAYDDSPACVIDAQRCIVDRIIGLARN